MPAGFLNALDWAYGDGANDDANALNQAAQAAAAMGKHLWVPKTAASYDIGSTVTIPAEVSLKSFGAIRLKSGIAKSAPAVVVGASGAANAFQIIELRLDNAGRPDWSSDSYVGVRLYNPQNCLIDVRHVKGCTVGVEIVTDGSHQAMNNEIRLGLIEDCRYAVQFTGAVRDNRLMTGRWRITHSADVERALWRITNSGASGNLWLAPSAQVPRFSAANERRLSYLHTAAPMNRIWSLGDGAELDVPKGDAHILADGAAAHSNLVDIGRWRSAAALTIARINSAPASRNGLIRRRDRAENMNAVGGTVS